jgi:tetratricopeptide (TPR) repeat protein
MEIPACDARRAARADQDARPNHFPSQEHMKRLLSLILVLLISHVPGWNAHAQLQGLAQVWNSPNFQRQLLGSYGIDSEVEPLMNEEERELHDKLVQMIPNNPDGVGGALEKLITPESTARYELLLANLYAQKGDGEKAVDYYQKAVEKFPRYRTAWNNLGVNLVKLNRHPEAVKAFTRAIELGASNGIMYGLLGFSYMTMGQFIPAESAYRMAVLLDPATPDWKLGLANVLLRQEKYADAVAMMGQLIVENPEKTDLWLLQANGYLGMKRALDAAGNFEFVHRLGKATPETLNTLGDIYISEDLVELAALNYKKAFELEPEKGVPGLLRASEILMTRAAPEQARDLLATAQAGAAIAGDDRQKVLKLRAKLALSSGEDEEAAQALEEAVKLNPLDGDSLILLGQYHARKSEVEQAIFIYERAAAIEAFEADAKVRHAQLLVQQSRFGEAIPLLKRAQEVKPRESVAKFVEELERYQKMRR